MSSFLKDSEDRLTSLNVTLKGNVGAVAVAVHNETINLFW